MPEIILKKITKRFGDFVAVDNLDLVIDDGDFVTLLGPSGCGKTTTLRQIAGLETPSEGEIYIDGQLVYSSEKRVDIPPAKREVGFLFQNYALWPHMTVNQNIAFGLENLKWSKEDIKKRVDELLALLRIEEFGGRYPAELSGGQQQRVAIARTLATHPKVLLMDEPLSNLDAKLRMEMRAELKRLHRETGATFVYVTHDQLEAMTLATKICLLDDGELQQYAPPLTVYMKPANLFVATFVGNPTINLVEFNGAVESEKTVALNNPSISFRFTAGDSLKDMKDGKMTIGSRPEFISISQDSKLLADVVSSLPSGMETILQLQVENLSFSSVVFGSLDFPIGSKIPISFTGNNFVLFDSDGKFRSCGSVELV
ncbi:Maltose/maltodextrin import ATP-binding protein MalK [bioreactor metagenome]|uniref:Maltose/maltodextrin import ATP-binding protein MalK n=1 Tax=bioreactor metagenome TaxID=1076179 RepID=A0A644Y8D1_9ZZZZ